MPLLLNQGVETPWCNVEKGVTKSTEKAKACIPEFQRSTQQ